MELEQIINDNPQLNKISEKLINQISFEKYSINLDYNKTFGDNGFDDLDCIEMVMEIEKRLDILISDDIIGLLFDVDRKPPKFKEYWRNKKLEDLGI